MNFYQEILLPPHFDDDPEKTRKAEFLQYLTLTQAGMLLFIMLLHGFFTSDSILGTRVILFVLILAQALLF